MATGPGGHPRVSEILGYYTAPSTSESRLRYSLYLSTFFGNNEAIPPSSLYCFRGLCQVHHHTALRLYDCGLQPRLGLPLSTPDVACGEYMT